MRRTLDTARHRRLVEILVAHRKTSGLTQEDFAARLDLPQSVVSLIERGGRRIDIVELFEIAQVVDLDLHMLIDELAAVSDPA